MAEHTLASLENGPVALAAGDSHQVVVHIERDEVAGIGPLSSDCHNHHHRCSLEDGPVISPATFRRLACDGGLLTVLQDGQGNILNIGRKTRAVPTAMRRALLLRDRSCRFPGCCQARHVDAHHIHHWADGGETRMDNLVLLCRHHHRLIHELGYEIRQPEPVRFQFIAPAGGKIPHALFPQFESEEARAEQNAIEHIHQTLGLSIDAETAVTRWEGEPMDYDWCVGTLLDYEQQQTPIPAGFTL
ncbi:MAG: hypothetical protein RLZZ385_2319 [Pseudomonadota bacterium]|jgi:hypothetical protein